MLWRATGRFLHRLRLDWPVTAGKVACTLLAPRFTIVTRARKLLATLDLSPARPTLVESSRQHDRRAAG
jgi:hypothetical protein